MKNLEQKEKALARKRRKEFCEVSFVSASREEPSNTITLGDGALVGGNNQANANSNSAPVVQLKLRKAQKAFSIRTLMILCSILAFFAAVAAVMCIIPRGEVYSSAFNTLYFALQGASIALGAALGIFFIARRLYLPWWAVPLPLVISVCTYASSFGGYVCAGALLAGALYFAAVGGGDDYVGRILGTLFAAALCALSVWQFSSIVPAVKSFGKLGSDISTLLVGAIAGGLVSATIFAFYNLSESKPFAAVVGLPALAAANLLFNFCVGALLVAIAVNGTFVYSNIITIVCLLLALGSAVALILAVGCRAPVKYIYMFAIVPALLIVGVIKIVMSLLKKAK